MERRGRISHPLALIVIGLALIGYLFPVLWIMGTSLKTQKDIYAIPPKVVRFDATGKNFAHVFKVDTNYLQGLAGTSKEVSEATGAVKTPFPRRFINSVLISGAATVLALAIGTLSAYAFSRFKVKGKGDLLFFILSTRMLPPVAVVIPIFLMYRSLHMIDTYHGMILLYTAFNIPFAVWMMKGFIDEIPKEYEDAAMVDGYTRLEAFWKVIVPQAWAGIAATAVFCIITVWNEFLFSLILTGDTARTAPPSIVTAQVVTGTDWGQVAAASTMFVIPVFVFTFLVRNHLLRGVTFGAVRHA